MIHLPTFWDSPAGRLQVTYSTSTTLHFDLLGNHCCCNKPTDALVSQTLLYYYRVIRGRPLLAPLPSTFIYICFISKVSIFLLIILAIILSSLNILILIISLTPLFFIEFYIIIIYCLTSDSDPYWAHADYSIYIGRKLYLRKPCNLSLHLLELACRAPASHL